LIYNFLRTLVVQHTFLAYVVMGAFLCGCSDAADIVAPADLKLAPVVFSWLPDQDGQILVFQDGAGHSQSLRVTREQSTKQVRISKSSPFTRGTETLYVAYRGLPAQPNGFSLTTAAYTEVAARNPEIVFYCTDVPVYANGLVPSTALLAAVLNPNSGDSTPAGALQSAYTIGPRTYAAMLHLDNLATQQGFTGPAALQELFFARDAGLVAFQTNDGQLWLRK
jgi:hypothetical protein